jgi:hypothetical protein
MVSKVTSNSPRTPVASPSVPKLEPKPVDAAPKVQVPAFDTSSFAPAADRVANKETLGRAVKSGNGATGSTDESIGRAKVGVAGSTDESIGRPTASKLLSTGTKVTGSNDESIGRSTYGASKKKTGNNDESIGTGTSDPVRDSLVGPENDPIYLAKRDAIFNTLENPSATVNLKPGDPAALPALKKTLATAASKLGATVGKQLTDLGAKLDEAGQRLLGALAEKSPELLSQKDRTGNTLLSNLTRLANTPFNANVAADAKMKDVVNSTLQDVVNPNRIDQGTAPTCTVTSMQFELVADAPAEYVRTIADLAGPQASSTMSGGGALQLKARAASAAALDSRSASDAIFQTAAMEYANGRYANYDPVSGMSTDTRTGAQTQGLLPAQQSSLLEQLFGVKYSTKNFYTEADGQKALDSLQGFDSAKNQNRPVILQIDQGTINHAVTLEKVADGRVTFRDPYGVLRSIPQELFPKYVVGVQQPIAS